MKKVIEKITEWLRARGMSEEDIKECIEYITKK